MRSPSLQPKRWWSWCIAPKSSPWLALVPNLQYISNPSAMRELDDAWVVGLRFELVRDQSWQLSARRDVAPDGSYVRR